jgi:hypothetical protein
MARARERSKCYVPEQFVLSDLDKTGIASGIRRRRIGR